MASVGHKEEKAKANVHHCKIHGHMQIKYYKSALYQASELRPVLPVLDVTCLSDKRVASQW